MFKNGKIYTGSALDMILPGPAGVRTYEKDKCCPGYTLFSPAMGSTEYLIDMHGLVVHTWSCTHSQLAELLPNGNLMVDNYGNWIEELAPDGSLLWRWDGGQYHHDFFVLPSGNVVLLTSTREPISAGYYASGFEPEQMLTDHVLEIDRAGNVLWRFAFKDHIEELCTLARLPRSVRYMVRAADGSETEVAQGDWAHTNTIEVLPDTPLGRRDSRFRAGNLLFSFRALDVIGIIDRDRNAIVWAWGLGVLDGQHQPTMLPDGNILVFDNGTYRGCSAAVEMDPETGDIVWDYRDPDAFFSPFRAGVQRLDNGNTLICSSDQGRLFEVTPEKELVWDYWSPFLAQAPEHQGRHIYRATRYSEDFVMPLLKARQDNVNGVATMDGHAIRKIPEAVHYYTSSFDGGTAISRQGTA